MRSRHNRPAHVCERLDLPTLPDETWFWNIESEDSWGTHVVIVFLMQAGRVFNSKLADVGGFPSSWGDTEKEAIEKMAERCLEKYLTLRNAWKQRNEVWAR